jgi:cytoskeletal protein CcmA (bactofilin family)
MFSRNKGKAKAAIAPLPPSILGKDLKIKGNLNADGDIQLDGKVEGDISTTNLTVGEYAVVHGTLTCDSVIVAGAVHGGINAKIVVLSKTATVIGDIHHESLSIEAGATVDGLCRHVSRKKAHAEPPLTRPSLVVGASPDD